MRLVSILIATIVFGLGVSPARAQERSLQWGVQGALGLSTGDLKDTADQGLSLNLGGHMDYAVMPGHTLSTRLDGLFFQAARKRSSGSTGGNPWTHDLQTKVQGWTLGAEYILQLFKADSRVSVGGGVHLVRWTVDSTDTLDITTPGGGGRVVDSSNPSWTKVGISLVAGYQISPKVRAEVRVLSSSYGWEGERVQVGQFGLSWTF